VHQIVEERPDWQQLSERHELISTSEASYRSDPEAGRNLETVQWTPERRAAAVRGQVLIVDPDQARHSGPLLDLDKVAGRPVVQKTVSAWAEFGAMHAQVDADRTALLARIYPEVDGQARAREREVLSGVPDMQVQQLADVAVELTSLLHTLAAARTAAGLRPRTHGRLREQVTAEDVFTAAARMAAGQPSSLLDPVEQDRSVITGSVGIAGDHALGLRPTRPLPPAGRVLKDVPSTPEDAERRVAAMTTRKARPLGS
jgi:hypothetical protein